MPDQLNNNPALSDIFSSFENKFRDSILESRFEKNELSIKIKKEDLLTVIKFLKSEKGFNALNDIIALDNLKPENTGFKRFSLLYQLYNFLNYQRIRVIIDLDEKESADSIYSLYKSSGWAEREIFDMFGITFNGHPDLRRIYMPDDFKEFPLRKDFPLEGRQ
jgi:NADH/F420H2 dehydrogenase subunit C